MKNNQDIWQLATEENVIRDCYESIFENPCRFYNELGKELISLKEKVLNLVES